jgi:hypothetical protein
LKALLLVTWIPRQQAIAADVQPLPKKTLQQLAEEHNQFQLHAGELMNVTMNTAS